MVWILLFGKNGRLGQALSEELLSVAPTVAMDRSQCDLTDFKQLADMISAIRPAIIINAAAYTAVDQSQKDPQLAYLLNMKVPCVLAQCAQNISSLLVHFSTDYVFDGKKNTSYQESDQPRPLSIYGKSKWAGEKMVARYTNQFLIFRTSWLYGLEKENFVTQVLFLARQKKFFSVTKNQWGSPTATTDVARIIAKILKAYLQEVARFASYGLYHLCATGITSRYDLAKFIVDRAQYLNPITFEGIQINPITVRSEETIRPFCVELDTVKLQKTFGVSLPDWQSGLNKVIDALVCRA